MSRAGSTAQSPCIGTSACTPCADRSAYTPCAGPAACSRTECRVPGRCNYHAHPQQSWALAADPSWGSNRGAPRSSSVEVPQGVLETPKVQRVPAEPSRGPARPGSCTPRRPPPCIDSRSLCPCTDPGFPVTSDHSRLTDPELRESPVDPRPRRDPLTPPRHLGGVSRETTRGSARPVPGGGDRSCGARDTCGPLPSRDQSCPARPAAAFHVKRPGVQHPLSRVTGPIMHGRRHLPIFGPCSSSTARLHNARVVSRETAGG